MPSNVINVTASDDLGQILSADRRHARRVVLALDSLESTERARWEARINKHYRACGCGSAALALVATLLLGGAALALYRDLLMQRPFLAGGLGLAALIASLGTGKAFGLWIARLRLRSTVSSLQQRLA
jgi:hypothetical protein